MNSVETITAPDGSQNASHPLVTIGLPVYNGAAYLEQAIASLQAQTYPNIEILISDNCSTDDTSAICETFAAEDPRIRYTRTTTNIGAAGNFNRVASLATGDLFAWANHDDLWHQSYIEKAVIALGNNPDAILAYPRASKIDETGETILELNAGFGLDSQSPADRLRTYHELFAAVDRRDGWGREPIEGFWIPVYGVIRANALRRSSMIGNFISSDTILIEELLILGAFVELEERLFFKRDHTQRSMRDSEAYDARSEWFSGKSAARLIFPRWRAFKERMRAAITLPSGSDKQRCAWEMVAFYFRRRSEGNALIKEVIVNAGRLILGPKRAAKLFGKW